MGTPRLSSAACEVLLGPAGMGTVAAGTRHHTTLAGRVRGLEHPWFPTRCSCRAAPGLPVRLVGFEHGLVCVSVAGYLSSSLTICLTGLLACGQTGTWPRSSSHGLGDAGFAIPEPCTGGN
jgi:hypothetical protein